VDPGEGGGVERGLDVVDRGEDRWAAIAEGELGGLPYLTPLQVTNPRNGRSFILYKRDIGAGQPISHTLDGYHYRIDMGVDYDGQGEIDAIGDARVTFAGTGIGGGWVCSTPTNGGIVYQLDDGPDRANGSTSPRT